MPVALLVLTAKEQIKEASASPNGHTKATSSTKALDGKELKRLVALNDKSPDEFKKQYLAYLAANVDPSVYLIKSSGPSSREKEQAAQMKKELEQDYKARSDVKAVINQELTEFITLVNSVDFNAKLVKQGGKMVFANPAYESKSGDWKALYRMGREPVMAARAFAQQWQAELGKKQK
jgi:flagellar basal body rod protein FlgG